MARQLYFLIFWAGTGACQHGAAWHGFNVQFAIIIIIEFPEKKTRQIRGPPTPFAMPRRDSTEPKAPPFLEIGDCDALFLASGVCGFWRATAGRGGMVIWKKKSRR